MPAAAFGPLSDRYAKDIRPLVERFCHECHSAKKAEADVDLLRVLRPWAQVRKQPQVWQKVGEMLDSGQMPPKERGSPNQRNELGSNSGCAVF